MAKYVQYTPDVFCQSDGPGVSVWWFPTTFSQSQLGDRIIGKNYVDSDNFIELC